MEPLENLSAFAAYNMEVDDAVTISSTSSKESKANKNKSKTQKTKSSSKKNAEKTFKRLSEGEMIASLIERKKSQMKRKLQENDKKVEKKNRKQKKNNEEKSNAGSAADITDNGSTQQPKVKHQFTLKIHPKNPKINISAFLSKKNKKNQKNASPVKKQNKDTEFTKIVHSTPNNAANGTKISSKLDNQTTTPKKKEKGKNGAVNGSSNIPRVQLKRLNIAEAPRSALLSDDNISNLGSIESARELFSWILNPIEFSKFMKTAWEKNPLFIDRKCPSYYEELISTKAIDRMLRENRVEFTKNIDITSYKENIRETHNPEGRAMPPTVWDFYNQGCSIRLLNPQTFLQSVHALNATLQELFQCMTGANVYLTPANSQGFAPHYDDIEAFVLQIEGKYYMYYHESLKFNIKLFDLQVKNIGKCTSHDPLMNNYPANHPVIFSNSKLVNQFLIKL